MGCKVVINNKMNLWITESELTNTEPKIWLADGIEFDGWYGFGDETIRTFKGNALLINFEKKQHIDLDVSIAHIKGKGPIWAIEASELPQPPFLITEVKDLNIVLNGGIKINLNDQAKEILKNYNIGEEYPIMGNESWFGILEIESQDHGKLIAFSSLKDCNIFDHEVNFIDWEISVGKIEAAE